MIHYRPIFPSLSPLLCAVAFAASDAPCAFGQTGTNTPSKVDFSYAFAAPHRITAGRPDASDRTLLDLQPGSLRMAWSSDNLTMEQTYPPLTFRSPPTAWSIQITPQIDGKPLARSTWARLDRVLPGVDSLFEDAPGSVRLQALSGMTAALVHIEIHNTDVAPHQFVLRYDSGNFGENPAWLDAAQPLGPDQPAEHSRRRRFGRLPSLPRGPFYHARAACPTA